MEVVDDPVLLRVEVTVAVLIGDRLAVPEPDRVLVDANVVGTLLEEAVDEELDDPVLLVVDVGLPVPLPVDVDEFVVVFETVGLTEEESDGGDPYEGVLVEVRVFEEEGLLVGESDIVGVTVGVWDDVAELLGVTVLLLKLILYVPVELYPLSINPLLLLLTCSNRGCIVRAMEWVGGVFIFVIVLIVSFLLFSESSLDVKKEENGNIFSHHDDFSYCHDKSNEIGLISTLFSRGFGDFSIVLS
jgi:hypothetical protein